MGATCTKTNRQNDFTVNIETSPAISKDIGGSVKILCEHKIECEWLQTDGSAALLELSNDRTTAFNVPAGTYEVFCSLMEEKLKLIVNVQQMQIPRIDSYTVSHATNDLSRNGTVEAHVQDLPENVKYLWTTGIITDDPILEDVRPGMYTTTLISKSNKLPILFYHACNPALVESKKNEFE